MHKLAAVLLLATAGLSTVACASVDDGTVLYGAESAPAVIDSVDDLPSRGGIGVALVDGAFVESLDGSGSALGGRTAIIAAGHQVCADLEDGRTSSGLQKLPHAERRAVSSAAVRAFCPEFAGRVGA